jgi:hypothetical protein
MAAPPIAIPLHLTWDLVTLIQIPSSPGRFDQPAFASASGDVPIQKASADETIEHEPQPYT